MEIEINGVRYQEIERKPKRVSKSIMQLEVMAMMFGGMGMIGSSRREKKKKESIINIAEEYGLIQQKKSRLSRSKRDWVVYKFNLLYRKID